MKIADSADHYDYFRKLAKPLGDFLPLRDLIGHGPGRAEAMTRPSPRIKDMGQGTGELRGSARFMDNPKRSRLKKAGSFNRKGEN